MSARILLADDEVRFAEALRQRLVKSGYEVTVVHDGQSALDAALGGDHDLMLLDLMLPVLSGYRVIERLRAAGSSLPVIMLTAKDGEYDEADAFDLGVDDYVTKPFSTVTLLARMRSLLRRGPGGVVPVRMEIGRLVIDARAHRCWVDDEEVTLTAREFAALCFLAESQGAVVSKAELLEQVWDDPDLDPNAVEVCILQVRRKLGSESIETIRGAGYRLTGA